MTSVTDKTCISVQPQGGLHRRITKLPAGHYVQIEIDKPGAIEPKRYWEGTKTKILVKLAERYIPMETIYRRKVGFTVPLTPWFQGPLRKWVRRTLLDERSLGRGYYRPEAVRRVVDDQLEGRVDRSRSLWSLLAIELWHRLYVDDDGSESAADRLKEEVMASVERPAMTSAGANGGRFLASAHNAAQ